MLLPALASKGMETRIPKLDEMFLTEQNDGTLGICIYLGCLGWQYYRDLDGEGRSFIGILLFFALSPIVHREPFAQKWGRDTHMNLASGDGDRRLKYSIRKNQTLVA